MRVLVIGDMEGVAGICRWDQVAHDGAGYEEGRGLYTAEMNAAAAGAFAAGATEMGGGALLGLGLATPAAAAALPGRPRSCSWTATAPAGTARSTR